MKARQKGGVRDWRGFQNSLQKNPRRALPWRGGLRIFALLVAISIACATLLYAGKENRTSRAHAVKKSSPRQPGKKFQLPADWPAPHFAAVQNGKYTEERDGRHLVYTADPALHAKMDELFRASRPSFSAFVALEPRTGKILALTGYARQNGGPADVWQRATYPAASIFKIITAAGALEKGLLEYDSPVSYRGNFYRLGPQKLIASSRRDLQTHFDEALGKSNNVVFGRVANKIVGSQLLRETSEAFGFNRPIPFDFPVEASKALIPEGSSYELARCGAGFGKVTLNPLHAAMIAAAVANGGVMMRPYLIEEIRDPLGGSFYEAEAEVAGQSISAKTAFDLTRMMSRTVEDGTAAKVFQRYGRPLLNRVSICGKTGSLSGNDPPGHYDWFIGFAPAENPQIAFAAMIVNQDNVRVKGAFVAQAALKTFFRNELNGG
jgi:penicillin-binding protein A